MEKRLKVTVFTPDGLEAFPMTAKHMDVTSRVTHFYNARFTADDSRHYEEHFIIPAAIDHYNMIDGLLTLYYKNGFFVEVRRIYC